MIKHHNAGKDIDRDKTPIVVAPKASNSTISRLESKYSDVLGRVARRRKEQEEDREKTLEPQRPYMNPVTRSATTVLCEKAYQSYQKERTPYKLHKNRNKYLDDGLVFKPRSELSLLQENNRYSNSKKSKYLEYDPIRRKDTLYDAYSRQDASGGTNRYGNNSNNYRNDYASAKTRGCDIDYGHYYGSGKENSYKSRYDPDMLYAEINNNNTLSNGNLDSANDLDRDRQRQTKSYKRTGTSTDRRHTTNFKELKSDAQVSTNRYATRKSSDYQRDAQRSQTQKFFDSETMASAKNLVAKIAEEPTIAGEVLTEREARRKEIQSLIMKYAQLDDCYNKATEDLANNNNTVSVKEHVHQPPPAPLQQPPQIAMSIAPINIGMASAGGFLPLCKTQSVSAMTSLRSRIPLTTFVRLCCLFFYI